MMAKDDKIAAVLIRGLIGVRKDTKETLYCIRLRKKHACVIMADSPVFRGMLQKSKDFIAYGPVSEETIKVISAARTPAVNENGVLLFNMAPPRGGFERGGIKRAFGQGGALGFRKDMGALLKRML